MRERDGRYKGRVEGEWERGMWPHYIPLATRNWRVVRVVTHVQSRFSMVREGRAKVHSPGQR